MSSTHQPQVASCCLNSYARDVVLILLIVVLFFVLCLLLIAFHYTVSIVVVVVAVAVILQYNNIAGCTCFALSVMLALL